MRSLERKNRPGGKTYVVLGSMCRRVQARNSRSWASRLWSVGRWAVLALLTPPPSKWGWPEDGQSACLWSMGIGLGWSLAQVWGRSVKWNLELLLLRGTDSPFLAIFSLYSVPEAFFFGFHLLAIRLNICCARRWEETNTDKSTRFLEKKIIHAQTHREPGLQHNSLIRKNIICRIEYAFCHFHQVTVYLLNLHLDFSYSYWFLHPILPWGYSHFWNPSQLGIRPDWY